VGLHMADEKVETHMFRIKEVTEALVKFKGLNEGFWMIYLEFKLLGSNTGPSAEEVYPTAIIPVTGFGLQRVKEMSPLSVDAAQVNPAIMTE
jgi:hypothetical protein